MTLCWQQKDDIGFSIGYRDISLHAISKDINLYPKECLYIIIDSHIHMPGYLSPQHAENSEDSDAESEPDLSELLLVTEETSTIPIIYEALKVCQELNPDINDTDDEDDNIYMDAENEVEEEYDVAERGGGDADIDELSRRIQGNSVDIHYSYSNGNDEEEFQDAD